MTDAELNRAVAEARGWTKCTCGDPDCPYWTDTNGIGQTGKVCSDSAAWGALYTEIAEAKMGVDMLYSTFHNEYIATVWNKQREPFSCGASSPGRALAQAFLKAKGETG